MDTSAFWDIVGPLSLIAFVMIIVWSLYGLKKKSFFTILIGSLLNFGIAYIFSWSIGKLLIIVPILQFIAALYVKINKRYRPNN